jgi:hypothetical protein
MARLMDEIKLDLSYLRSHTLQPKWFKIVKIFILLGLLVGYAYLFGLARTALFFAAFVALSLVVHFAYRTNTKKWTQSWLDFVVIAEEDGETRTKRIGKFYYAAVTINLVLAVAISRFLPR